MPEIQFDESGQSLWRQQLLQANQTLQESIRQELRTLAQHKAQNRSWALFYTRQLRKTQNNPQLQPQQQQHHSTFVKPRKTRKKNDTTTTVTTATTTNLYGKRLERFFSDLQHSQPEPNADSIHRRQQLEASTFFHHTQPPWSSAQDQALQKVVEEHSHRQDTINWDQIAQILHEQLPTGPRRSPDECRIHYSRYDTSNTNHSTWSQLLTHYKTNPPVNHPWTLPQDNFLFTCIAAAGPQHVWGTDAIVHLTTKFFPHKTRKQFFSRIHQSLLNPNYSHDAWTLQEERKLVLLMKFYHEGSSQQNGVITTRTADSERRRSNENVHTNDDDDDDFQQHTRPRQHNSSLTLYRASSHFPRNTKSVADKWHRTLNPEQYTTRPFTSSEKQTLLRVMQEHPTIGWVQLSQQHFPNRHPHRLLLQWYEQAPVEAFAQREELLQQHQEQLKKDELQRGKRSIAAATDQNLPKQRTRII